MCFLTTECRKPFFIDPQQAKVTGPYYTRHLERDLLPECKRLYPDDDYIYMQDGASSHTSNICQNKLHKLCKARGGRDRFLSKTEWPTQSCDLNSLDHHFWDAFSNLVYEGRNEPFENLAQLSRWIKQVGPRACNIINIQKAVEQFLPWCRKVVEFEGERI